MLEAYTARIPMKTHLLKCAIKRKNCEARINLMKAQQEIEWICKWSGCCSGPFDNQELAATHVTNHLDTKWPQCHWNECAYVSDGEEAMQAHLLDTHGVYTKATIPVHANFCIECSHWVSNKFD
jgi:hypothetical protein